MGRWRDRYEWDYYSENRPRKVEGGIKAKSERGAIGETWWSKRWVEVLESLGMGTRLTRGRSYARQGQVLSINTESGIVKAKVQGSRHQPYAIKIRLEPLSDRNWEQVTTIMASQALFAAKLLAGEMPKNIEDAFSSINLSLFPATEKDLQTDCSCPDWANPCKHIAAVYYILAERFDEDPFLLFKLRGRTKEAIIATLREKRVEKLVTRTAAHAVEAVDTGKGDADKDISLRLEDHLETFWLAGETLDSFAVNPHVPDVDQAILRRLGDAPFSVEGQNVTSYLSRAYKVIREAVASYEAAE